LQETLDQIWHEYAMMLIHFTCQTIVTMGSYPVDEIGIDYAAAEGKERRL